MNRYDESYSAYFAAPDADYPVGSAIDSTSEDNLDGTPYLAAFFNDVIGFMQAAFFGVFGTDAQVSNTPETARKSDVWNAIQKFVGDSDKAVKDALDADITSINAKIPSQASAQNQLADKDFVNSSIATNTAYFIGTFNSVAELNAYTGTKTNNDYAFVQSTDAAGNTIFKRYKWNGTAWLYEYELNNSSFTSAQWAAVNSGATAAKINQIKQMTGATASAAGASGFVPAPAAGAQDKFLRGDGTWQSLSIIIAQTAFNAAHPIGEIYTQYPQQYAPATLYNKNGIQSTWQVVSYSGAFFRAEGGNAAAFIEKTGNLIKQSGQNGSHSHSISGTVSISAHRHGQRIGGFDGNPDVSYIQIATKGVYTGNPLCDGYPAQNTSWVNGREQVFTDYASPSATLSASITAQGGVEARPDNFTIRVWKRTA